MVGAGATDSMTAETSKISKEIIVKNMAIYRRRASLIQNFRFDQKLLAILPMGFVGARGRDSVNIGS